MKPTFWRRWNQDPSGYFIKTDDDRTLEVHDYQGPPLSGEVPISTWRAITNDQFHIICNQEEKASSVIPVSNVKSTREVIVTHLGDEVFYHIEFEFPEFINRRPKEYNGFPVNRVKPFET